MINSPVHAAVLLLVIEKDKILFIKRNAHLSKHAGEVSFPGGKFDEKTDKNLLETAKREVLEEIGLSDSHYNVKGELSPEHTVSTNFLVHTYIAETLTIPKFNINKKEVEKIILVPIKHLKNKRYHVKVPLKLNEKLYFNTFYYYKKHLIWGATSRILDNFLKNHG